MKNLEGRFHLIGSIHQNPVTVNVMADTSTLSDAELNYIHRFYNSGIYKFTLEVKDEHTILLHKI